MRQRTLFGILTNSTNQLWFCISLIVLRVVVGISILFFGLVRIADWSVVSDLSKQALFHDWFQQIFVGSFLEALLPWVMVVCGVCLIGGMLVRPASAILIIVNLFVYAWMFNSGVWVSNELLLIICLLVFLSGGVGHTLGLDYFLYSYAKERTWVTKVLVG
ncbi:hypothetical protein L6260_02335 [Candidatus Parcubacteria bacterium]|nr:hypothetical protein [Candidatus Parcubacteria bacterium]